MSDVRHALVKDSLLREFSSSILIETKDESNWWFLRVYGPSNACHMDHFRDELAEFGACVVIVQITYPQITGYYVINI